MSENDNNSGDDQSSYEAPATTSEEPGTPDGPELAGRGVRLGAYLVDSLILAIVFLVVVASGFWITFDDIIQMGTLPGTNDVLQVMIVFIVVFMVINGYLLVMRGQTVGKLMLGIRIVDSATGGKVSAAKVLGLRYIVFFGLQIIPVFGMRELVSLFDAVFIFRDDRRCLHDLLAGTKVVSNS